MHTYSTQRRMIYVLTAWQERPASPDRPAVWRFSLEDAPAGQRYGFGSLTELTAFLELELGPGRGPSHSPAARGTEERRNEKLDSASS